MQIVLMVSGFLVLGYALLWDMDDATGWQCRAIEIGTEPVQTCDTEDGMQTPVLLGMSGLALEIAGVSVAVGARRRDPFLDSASVVPVSFPSAPVGPGQPPHTPAAAPSPWPTQMPPQAPPRQH
ncbi:hypothetical protein GCM10011583_73860 [Streptomyces camponoticapitis]|uniref:Uncharacterized protein n=1 Tax=Streptomyces camponoticapitis TaxID=1616125 RepID=A0ABQ2EXM4_9ACTN|nr:hypothetical protein GCM10011583_73860 [Streptomyces camponoticapitis]